MNSVLQVLEYFLALVAGDTEGFGDSKITFDKVKKIRKIFEKETKWVENNFPDLELTLFACSANRFKNIKKLRVSRERQ